jgi:upstream activation factor subunit UAF30
MVSDQEIASCVESVLSGSAGGPGEASLAAVLQQAEAKLGMDLSHKASFIREQMDLFFGPRLQAPPPKPQNPPPQANMPRAQPQGQVVAQVPAQQPQQMQQQLTALQPQLIFQPMAQLPAVVPGATVPAVSSPPAVPAMAFYPPPPLAFRYTTGLGGATTGGTVSFQQPAPVAGGTASPNAAVQAAGDNKERWALHLIRVFVPRIGVVRIYLYRLPLKSNFV